MAKEKIDSIAEDYTTTIEYANKHGLEYGEHDPSEIDAYLYAQYLNHLIDQVRLCWDVIRNQVAKQ